jgi:hypothetical protein
MRVQVPTVSFKSQNASTKFEPLKIAFERLETCMVTGQNGLASILSMNYGGGEGSRTPVRNHILRSFYGCIPQFDIPDT